MKNVNKFIDQECNLPNDYLLNKKIDPKKRSIQLVFGGIEIPDEAIGQLKMKSKRLNLGSRYD